jgi:DNA-binding response OmpR family regulator
VEIIVRDTGIGIPEGELPHIFDRFYQVDGSQTREQEGTGIGLALTKELVELHNGTITVRSAVGKGTEFLVRFPTGSAHLRADEIKVAQPVIGERALAPLESPGHAPSGNAGVQTPDGTHPIVLVVEDNIDVRAYIRQYLVQSYQVLEAQDGREGVEKATEAIPDLIISDVMMPKMDGYELCRTLKLDEKTSHVPIILLTAKAGQENKIEGLETGADDYITKPFDAKELLVRVKNLIDLRRKLRERFSVGQVLKPGEIAVTSIDDAFLKKVMGIVEARLGEEGFSVEDLALEAGMSRSQLHRKMTALTGQSPSEFVRYMRLHRAMALLKKNAGTVSEIAYTVGFSGVSYFTKCFREQFGLLPSDVKQS